MSQKPFGKYKMDSFFPFVVEFLILRVAEKLIQNKNGSCPNFLVLDQLSFLFVCKVLDHKMTTVRIVCAGRIFVIKEIFGPVSGPGEEK